MRRWLRPFWVILALLFLLEAWLWDHLQPAVARVVNLVGGGKIKVGVPTMIVWGQSDRVIPLSAALSYHRRIPGSRLEIFERTGHVPQLERPLRFNRLLDEFLG